MKKRYDLNTIRIADFEGKKLITAEHGEWELLTKKEFKQLETNTLSKELYKKLHQKNIILDQKNTDITEKKLRIKKIFLFQGTSLHIIVPTLRCNLKCVYCHASKKPAENKKYDMTRETAKKTVDFIFQTPSPSIKIEFQGGEPLLNLKIIRFIVRYAKEKNRSYKKKIEFTIVTNLTLMNNKIMDYLIKEGFSICTSLDGPKELHNKNRPNSYDKTAEWIRKINSEYKKRNIPLKASALLTTTKQTLKYPEKIIDEYIKNELDTIHLRFLNNLGDARPEWKTIGYNPKEFIDFYDKSITHIKKANKKAKKIEERTYRIFNAKINSAYDPNYLEIRSPCGAVTGQLLYNYDGKIHTCDEGRMTGNELFALGDVHKDDYAKITTCPKTISMITASTLETLPCDACAYKPYCGVCPVCNYAEQGSVIAKTPQTSRCQIYKHIIKKVISDTAKKRIKKNQQ